MKTAELELDASWDPKEAAAKRKTQQHQSRRIMRRVPTWEGLGVPDQGGTNKLPPILGSDETGSSMLHLVLDVSLQSSLVQSSLDLFRFMFILNR